MVGVAGGKEIRCAGYATFGSQELSNKVVHAMRDGIKACLMANHGMICHDKSLKGALKLAVEVECLSKQYIEASSMGPPPVLSEEEMSVILAKFKTYGKQSWEVAAMTEFQQTHAVIPPPRRDVAIAATAPKQVKIATANENIARQSSTLQPRHEAKEKANILQVAAECATACQENPNTTGMLAYGVGAAVLTAVAVVGRRLAVSHQVTRRSARVNMPAPQYVYEGGVWRPVN